MSFHGLSHFEKRSHTLKNEFAKEKEMFKGFYYKLNSSGSRSSKPISAQARKPRLFKISDLTISLKRGSSRSSEGPLAQGVTRRTNHDKILDLLSLSLNSLYFKEEETTKICLMVNDHEASTSSKVDELDKVNSYESSSCSSSDNSLTYDGLYSAFVEIYSGGSRHMTGDKSKFLDITLRDKGYVTYEDNNNGKILGIGRVGNAS
ncbi:hypothetical protein Lal_00039576 [Lupinus albus]|nr:hypothetical protein Lal_00039576 [Lupinus albus]